MDTYKVLVWGGEGGVSRDSMSKVKGKICSRCWANGFKGPDPPAAGLITTFFPSKKQKKE